MLIWPLRKVYVKLCQLSADTIHTDIYIYQICVIWYSECCSDYYFITVDQPELAFGQNLFLLLRLRCVFFLSLQRISRLALEWIKFKITWEYHWSVDLNRKTGKKHHEHGGLLCFIAVNSACVMTKELSSFWIKGSRFVLEPQTISWLL